MIDIRLTDNGTFLLLTDTTIQLDDTRRVELHRGMRTDFASIPSIARALISPIDPDIAEAAIVHDYLVGQYTGVRGVVIKTLSTGAEVRIRYRWDDACFWLAYLMKRNGAPVWKRAIVNAAVRIYGWVKHK